MLADVAPGEGAVDRVREGVHAHICVGMTLKAAVMRDFDPTEPDMIADAEPVHVIAISETYLHASCVLLSILGSLSQQRFRAGEIFGPGDFEILFGALGDRHVDPGGTGHFDVVGGLCGHRAGKLAVCL